MRRRATLALIVCIAAPGLSYAAKKEPGRRTLPDCSSVAVDGFALPEHERRFLLANQQALLMNDVLGFAIGGNSLVGDYYTKEKIGAFNPDILELKVLAKQPGFASLLNRDFETFSIDVAGEVASGRFTRAANSVLLCQFGEVASPVPNAYNAYVTQYLKTLQTKQSEMTGHAGYFDASVNSCTISESVDTGNRLTTLKLEPDSRYLTVNATFKNTDTEGRIPLEGSLIISSSGKDYKFDTTESVVGEGFGIRMRPLNPLIKLNTKIVYKVPNELSGEVYWRPGRNPNDTKLWCTYLPAA